MVSWRSAKTGVFRLLKFGFALIARIERMSPTLGNDLPNLLNPRHLREP